MNKVLLAGGLAWFITMWIPIYFLGIFNWYILAGAYGITLALIVAIRMLIW